MVVSWPFIHVVAYTRTTQRDALEEVVSTFRQSFCAYSISVLLQSIFPLARCIFKLADHPAVIPASLPSRMDASFLVAKNFSCSATIPRRLRRLSCCVDVLADRRRHCVIRCRREARNGSTGLRAGRAWRSLSIYSRECSDHYSDAATSTSSQIMQRTRHQ